MGQYYMPCFIANNNEGEPREVLKWARSHDFNNGLKLMEHSYVGNDFVAVICAELYKAAQRLVWAGDYADTEEGSDKNLCDLAQEADKIDPRKIPLKYYRSAFRYVVNYDKKEFVHLNRQPKDSYGWQISPLPLLTAEGNGRGGGDYEGTDMQFVGSWAGDLIQVVPNKGCIPKGYTEIMPVFKERGTQYSAIPTKPSEARRLRPDILRRLPLRQLLQDPAVRDYFNAQAVRSARFFKDRTFIPSPPTGHDDSHPLSPNPHPRER